MSKKKNSPSAKHFVKLIHHQSPDLVCKFVQHVLDESGIDGMVFEDYDTFKCETIVHFSGNTEVSQFVEAMISSYETLGMHIDIDVDIYDLTVYTSCPELNAYYMQSRMNINQTAFEAFSDIMHEVSNQCDNVQTAVTHIDGQNTLNGVYKLRKVLQVISEALEGANIPIVNRLNSTITEIVH